MAMMIQRFHKLIQSKVLWIAFLFLIAFSMVFFGVILPSDNYDPTQEVIPEGEYKGKAVDYTEFRHHYNQAYLKVTFRTLQPPNRTDEVEEQLNKMAWQRFAALKKAADLGLSATDEEVRSAIQQDPLFADQQGNFSAQTYGAFVQQFLPQLGINARVFEEHVREEVLIQKIQFMIYQASVIPPFEISRRFEMLRDNFTVEYAILTKAEVQNEIQVDDEAGQKHLAEFAEMYRVPEAAKIRMVQLDAEEFLDQVEPIPEEDLQAFYDRNLDQFTRELSEEDKVSETNRIQDAVAKTDAGEVSTDKETATEPADDKSEKTETADAGSDKTDEEVAVAETSAETSALDKIEFPGLDDISMASADLAIPDTRTVPFEDVREDIEKILRRDAALKLAAGKATDFVMALASTPKKDGMPFEAAAKQFGFDIIEIDPVTEDEVLFGMDAGPAFTRAAFSMQPSKDENFSDIIRGQESVYVLNLVEQIPSRIPEFAEIREQVIEDAFQAALRKRLQDKAGEIAEKAKAAVAEGKTFKEALAAYSLSTESIGPFNGNEGLEDNEDLADPLRFATLDFNAGEVCDPQPVEDGVLIPFVAKRELGDLSLYGAIQPQIASSVRRRNFQILYEDFLEQLLAEGNFRTRAELEQQARAEGKLPPVSEDPAGLDEDSESEGDSGKQVDNNAAAS